MKQKLKTYHTHIFYYIIYMYYNAYNNLEPIPNKVKSGMLIQHFRQVHPRHTKEVVTFFLSLSLNSFTTQSLSHKHTRYRRRSAAFHVYNPTKLSVQSFLCSNHGVTIVLICVCWSVGHDMRMLWMIWKTADPQTTNRKRAINAGPTGYLSSAFFKVLGTFPRVEIFLLCFSLASLIRCLLAIIVKLLVSTLFRKIIKAKIKR